MKTNNAYSGMQCIRSQTGATLIVAMILLFSITLVTLFNAKVGLIQQRTTANEYRAVQAMHQADSGIERIIAGLNDGTMRSKLLANRTSGKLDPPSDEAAVNTLVKSTSGEMTFTTTISNPTDYDFNTLDIQTNGCTDTCGVCNATCPSFHSVTQRVVLIDALNPYATALTAPSPLVVMGNVNLNGAAAMTTTDPGGILVTASGTITAPSWNPSVLSAGNPEVKTTGDAFFEDRFYKNKDTIRAIAKKIDCSDANDVTCELAIAAVNSKLFWFPNGLYLNDIVVGTATEPVVFIVENGINTGGTVGVTIHGLVYSIGDPNCVSNCNLLTINGVLMVEGDLTADGPDLTFNYDSSVLDLLTTKPALIARIGGSWSN